MRKDTHSHCTKACLKKKTQWIVLMCILLCFTVFSGCKESKQPEQEEVAATPPQEQVKGIQPVKTEKKITVGVSLLAVDNVFISDINSAMEAKAKELGIRLIVSDGQNSAEKQVSQVENFIAQMVDVILLNPKSMNGCKAAVESANRAGIPIITVNTLVENQDKCVTFVGSDAMESGRIQMEYVARLLNAKGNILILRGQIGHDAELGRRKGAQEILDKNPGIQVTFEQSANWSRGEGFAIVENCLGSGKKIDVVVSQNDEMALGAVEAIRNSGLQGKIQVVGIDAIPEALRAIEDGSMAGTVFQDAKGQGAMAIQAAYKVAKGEKLESRIYIPYVLVTRDDLPKYMN